MNQNKRPVGNFSVWTAGVSPFWFISHLPNTWIYSLLPWFCLFWNLPASFHFPHEEPENCITAYYPFLSHRSAEGERAFVLFLISNSYLKHEYLTKDLTPTKKTATDGLIRRERMLYAYYDSEVFYSLLLLQQLEVASPYAELLASVRKKKKMYSAYFIHCCKISNKIDVVATE